MSKKTKSASKKTGFESAAPSIKRSLISSLTEANVDGGVINVWSDGRFDGVNETVAKYRGNWLSSNDVNGIIIDAVFPRMQAINALDMPLQLSAHLNASEIEDIADEIVSYIGTIPRTYDILFPLPHLPVMADFVLTGPVSFVSRPIEPPPFAPQTLTIADLVAQNGITMPAGAPHPMQRHMYLKISAAGYATASRTVSAMHDAMAVLKRTVQVGIEKRVFGRRGAREGLLTSVLRGHDAQPILEALVFDTTGGTQEPKRVKLGLGMSSYLNEMVLHDWPPAPTVPSTANTVEHHLLSGLSLSVEALTHPLAFADSAALRSAFEWAFDAAADDEAIGGCIKTCIALEAALGEDSEERGITERIADRVAYVIGTNPNDRKRLREHMRNFYKLRSSLVHGKQSTINPSDDGVETTGRVILNMVLRKELVALEKWWRHNRPVFAPG